ncbi:MAG: hypothetical protein JF616_02265 [Fibrobacteres bacterium]|jgi:hypothetical protein|nr:hypothetical protein [Fibrobacterota bacterium]
MEAVPRFDPEKLPGLRWHPSGQTSLSGAPLRLFRRLDALFQAWAAECGAEAHRFPAFIAARDLARLDYFRSFPHLVTFPVTLDPDPSNLSAFAQGEPFRNDGSIRLAAAAPVREALTPAACYHFYALLQGSSLDAPLYLTTRAACFRRETHYLPLRRQWNFSMREIVCLGTADEVKDFLQRYREKLEAYFASIGLPIAWETATDPFFNPKANPKYLLQKLDPVKHEMVYRGPTAATGIAGSGPAAAPGHGAAASASGQSALSEPLAIGSINFHRNYFGEAFGIKRAGEDAYSGCVAFGLERWIYAFLEAFGSEPSRWPLPQAES